MAHRVETDISVQRFGYAADESGRRLQFPRVETHLFEGRSGSVAYGARDVLFDALEGRLDTLRWTADAASIGGAWLRDDQGRFDIAVDRIEMPRGIMLTRGEHGVEIVAPHTSLSEMKLTVKGPFGRAADRQAPPPPGGRGLRQDKLRFLDSLSGRIHLTIKVVLDLPVLGVRTLDQQLRVPIDEGSLDYRALDDSLDWLEGAFLDIKHDDHKLAVTWKVPIFGSSRDLIWWALDDEAATGATFGRVPARSLADFRFGGDRGGDRGDGGGGRRKTLQALSFDAIDIALSLVAPRSLEAGGGVIMFGGDDQPGMVDLRVNGSIRNHGPGALRGTIGSVDTTIKDVRFGPVQITADRLHFDGLDELEVTFDGFRPTSVAVVVHRVTATNLAVQLGRRGA
ncbi:MAG TPA: hypothetical protein VN253_10520 [Kofleriaceae bacterium]|nr:hypothetical protein [Kofleriaceae bacterium]